jgi:hypothetical protein
MRRSRAVVPSSARAAERGGAVVELAISALFLLLMVFGIVDFGRALLARHAITSMSREAGNLESRGTPLSTTLDATLDNAGSTNLRRNGYVILTAVQRDQRGRLSITQQVGGGGFAEPSRIGTIGTPDVRLPRPASRCAAARSTWRGSSSASLPVIREPDRSGHPLHLYDVAYF